jgi:hypothetical protein
LQRLLNAADTDAGNLSTLLDEHEAGRHPDDQYLAKLDEVARLRDENDLLTHERNEWQDNYSEVEAEAERLRAEVKRLEGAIELDYEQNWAGP